MGNSEMGTFYQKVKSDTLISELLEWWKNLQKNKGSRAQLKRCSSPAEAAVQVETYSLMNILPRWVSFEAAATIAGILAHIKENGSGVFAKKLGAKEKGKVLFSEARFKQLLSCTDWNELYTALRRAITMLDGNVNLISVIDAILQWDDEFSGKKYYESSKSFKFTLSKDYYSQMLK